MEQFPCQGKKVIYPDKMCVSHTTSVGELLRRIATQSALLKRGSRVRVGSIKFYFASLCSKHRKITKSRVMGEKTIRNGRPPTAPL